MDLTLSLLRARNLLFAAATGPVLVGCASSVDLPAPTPADARALLAFTGDGTALGWEEVMDEVSGADVVIIGEQHDDAMGHAVQQAIVIDAVARLDGVVLTLEMLERDEQPLVDDYFEEIIDAEQFTKLTGSGSWGSWAEWYQPAIDAVRDAGGRVAAANAPRRYVRLARTDGYERLDELPPPRSAWFERPDELDEGDYWRRFHEVMTGAPPPEHDEDDEGEHDEGEHDEGEHGEGDDETGGDDGAHGGMSTEDIRAMFRSQLVWDATMAATIIEELEAGAELVIHLVGQFHSDFEGGTVLEVRRRRPDARVLVISMQRSDSTALLDEDEGRADIVIYTGARDN
jgi:uncharacterized iron-regulated protein